MSNKSKIACDLQYLFDHSTDLLPNFAFLDDDAIVLNTGNNLKLISLYFAMKNPVMYRSINEEYIYLRNCLHNVESYKTFPLSVF